MYCSCWWTRPRHPSWRSSAQECRAYCCYSPLCCCFSHLGSELHNKHSSPISSRLPRRRISPPRPPPLPVPLLRILVEQRITCNSARACADLFSTVTLLLFPQLQLCVAGKELAICNATPATYRSRNISQSAWTGMQTIFSMKKSFTDPGTPRQPCPNGHWRKNGL